MMRTQSAYLLSEVGGLDEAERLRKQAGATLDQELAVIGRQLAPGASLVDLGCGSGVLDYALARARPDVTVQGVDADPLSVAEARRHFAGLPNLSFQQAPLEQGPPAGQAPADLGVLRLVLLHLPDAQAALRQCRNWIKPGGRLLVLECDDRAIEMEPRPAWLGGLLDLMEAVQAGRGGSRRRGLELGKLLEASDWELEIFGRLRFSMQALGDGFGRLFLPVAKFYLAEAVKGGLVSAQSAADLERRLARAFDGDLDHAMVPLFYALARPSASARMAS